MKTEFDRLESKLDGISEDIGDMKVTMAGQAADLKHHVKRTDQLEEMVLPLNSLRHEIKFVIKLIYFISAVAAIVEFVRAIK